MKTLNIAVSTNLFFFSDAERHDHTISSDSENAEILSRARPSGAGVDGTEPAMGEDVLSGTSTAGRKRKKKTSRKRVRGESSRQKNKRRRNSNENYCNVKGENVEKKFFRIFLAVVS